jgi:cold-inducible RNA-binding protein
VKEKLEGSRRRFMAQKLFVGGLPFSTSNDQLRDLFAEVGEVASATVVTDRDTGRSRGFGFVEMSTNEGAEEAISRFNGRDYEGRRLQVEKAKSPAGGGGGGRPARSGGGGGGFGRGGGGGNRW